MGSPLSPILADIVMEDLETLSLQKLVTVQLSQSLGSARRSQSSRKDETPIYFYNRKIDSLFGN